MRSAVFVLALVPAIAAAQKKDKPAPPAPAQSQPSQPKSKTYQFTGLDIDGKLKTPQLLYFLNRMKSEFDTTMPERRSFMPELRRSTDEM